MRSTSWTEDMQSQSTISEPFPISHWELPDIKTMEKDLLNQRLSDWKFFSTVVLKSETDGGNKRSRDRDSLSSNDSYPPNIRSDMENQSTSSSSSSSSKQFYDSQSSSLSSSPSKGSSSSSSSSVGSSNCERYKTELCRAYGEYGSCKYGEKCQFAHGKEELRSVSRHPKYKTDKCRTFYSTGFCPYGQRCHFIHDQQPTAAEPATCNKINKNRSSVGDVGQQLLIARQLQQQQQQQQLRDIALMQQLKANILYQQQNINQGQFALPLPKDNVAILNGLRTNTNHLGIPQYNAVSTNGPDKLIEAMKLMLTIAPDSTASVTVNNCKSVNNSLSISSGFRPSSLPFAHNPVFIRPASPVRSVWGGSAGSTTASSPTKSIPSSSSFFSPSPSPTTPLELSDLSAQISEQYSPFTQAGLNRSISDTSSQQRVPDTVSRSVSMNICGTWNPWVCNEAALRSTSMM